MELEFWQQRGALEKAACSGLVKHAFFGNNPNFLERKTSPQVG